MRSSFAALATIISAVFATGSITPAAGLQARGSSSSCSRSEFFWSACGGCIPTGGIPNTQCPSDRSCPSDWYYHPNYSSCVPKSPSSPPASCGGNFPFWNSGSQCCTKPAPPPTTPTPSCPSGHFFYSTKGCCLPNGGPGSNPQCPGDRTCPSDWWWHSGYSCCVPNNPNPPPTPGCPSGPFRHWDQNDQCCKQPPPTPSGSYNKRQAQPLPTRVATRIPKRSVCPADLQECPIKGSSEVECIDGGNEDLKNCGGCTTLGQGVDCTAIPNAVSYSCHATTRTCNVSSCAPGYTPSFDSDSCIPTMVSQ